VVTTAHGGENDGILEMSPYNEWKIAVRNGEDHERLQRLIDWVLGIFEVF
jgi:hypothetical protein